MRHDGTAPTEVIPPQPSSMLPGLAREMAEARLVTEIKALRRSARDARRRIDLEESRRLVLLRERLAGVREGRVTAW
jgi:hypothetical protein